MLLSLRNFGVIPSNLVTTYAMHVGSALEMLLLSFALAARFNTLKQQKEETQANLVSALRTHEQELEKKVQGAHRGFASGQHSARSHGHA